MAFSKNRTGHSFVSSLGILLGAGLAALALELFLIPNRIIDGGVVGIAILFREVLGEPAYFPALILLNIPFIILAYKRVTKSLVIGMSLAVMGLVGSAYLLSSGWFPQLQPYRGDLLEIVVIGGGLLGLGLGLVIRMGGCVDGSEVLAILLNKTKGYSVGNVILGLNILIFLASGFVFEDWHPGVQSFITYFVVMKVMDAVIAGFNDMKAVTILTGFPDEVASSLVYSMGLGLTFLDATGGYSGESRKLIYIIAERLQLVSIKEHVYAIDPGAFVAIHTLHEVTSHGETPVSVKVASR